MASDDDVLSTDEPPPVVCVNGHLITVGRRSALNADQPQPYMAKVTSPLKKFLTSLLVAGVLIAVPSMAGASTHKTTTTVKHKIKHKTKHKAKPKKAAPNSISNPVLFGQSAAIPGGWTVKIVSFAPDSPTNIMNTPTPGYVYEIIGFQATRTGSSSSDDAPSTSISDVLVGPSKAERNPASSPLCFTPDDVPSLQPDNLPVLKGGTVDFGDCISMSTSDSTHLTLGLGEEFSFNGKTIWFATAP